MINIIQPLVKLLRLADQLYFENQKVVRGRPFCYSERTMFKCFIVKTVKRLDDCSGIYNYLSHEANEHIRQEVGLSGKLPHLKTFQRRFEKSAPLMRTQLQAVAQSLAARGVISFEILSVDV